MKLNDLPPELIIDILASSSFKDILVCRRVCQRLKDIIEDSLELRYIVELAVAGYVDGPSNQLTKVSLEERYRKLVSLEEGWKTLCFPTAYTRTFTSPSSIYELYGGVFVRGFRGNAFTIGGVEHLQITQLPSPLNQSQGQTWDHLLESPCRDMTHDPGLDLMVIVKNKIGSRNTWEVTFTTLSGNQPHPDASSPCVTWTTNDWEHTWTCFNLSIMEDQVAVMFSPWSHPHAEEPIRDGDLVIWNWKTGLIRSALRGDFPRPTSFTFISPNVFMIGEVETRSNSFETPKDPRRHIRASLVVYAIPPPSDGKDAQVECQKVASFHLPLFKHQVIEVMVSSRSDPSPVAQRWPSTSPGVPGEFKSSYVDPLKRIIVLSLDLTVRRRSVFGNTILENREYTIFVHSSMFSSLLGEQRVLSGQGFSGIILEFDWKQWQSFARWTTLQRSPGSYVCYVYGQRYIDYEKDDYISRMHIWDFNPNVLRPNRACINPDKSSASLQGHEEVEEVDRKMTFIDPNRDIALSREASGLDEIGAGVSSMNRFALLPVIETRTSVIKDKDVFVYKKVKSSLPFRRTTGRAKLPPLSGIMLDEERIYTLERLDNSSAARMRILTIGPAPGSGWHGSGSGLGEDM